MNIRKFGHVAAVLMLAASPVALAACDNEGPAERAGEKIDNAAEKAADKIEDAQERAAEKIENATERNN